MTIALSERQTALANSSANASTSITTASGSLVLVIATAIRTLDAGVPALSLVSPASGAVEVCNVNYTRGVFEHWAVAAWVFRTDATTYSIEVSGGTHSVLTVHALEITSSDGAALDVYDYALNDKTASTSSTCTYLSVDTNTSDALVLAQGFIDTVTGIGVPSGYTQEYSVNAGGNTNILGSKAVPSPGPTGDQSDAMGASTYYVTMHFAIGNLGGLGFFNFEHF